MTTRDPDTRRHGMVVKDAAKQVINALPDDATMDDIIHALYMKAKFDRGEREIQEGRGIPQEEARERMAKWLR